MRRSFGSWIRPILTLWAMACSADSDIGGPDPEPTGPPTELLGSAIRLQVDLKAGTVVVTSPASAAGSAKGAGLQPSFALLGRNEIEATVSNLTRSAVGAFTPNRVRVRFDLALTNKLLNADLVPSTFPVPPTGVAQVVAFPFATNPAGLFGLKVIASNDWNGTGASGSGGPHNFFNDAICIALTPPGDCFRWEALGATVGAGSTTAAHTVGFDVDPSVTAFTVYVAVAADIDERPLPPGAATPEIHEIEPARARLGSNLSIIGKNFAATPAGNVLEFVPASGGAAFQVPVSIVAANDEIAQFTLEVPQTGAALPKGNYRLRVTSSGVPSDLSDATFERLLTGRVTTLAGGASGFADGVAAAARFNFPTDVAVGIEGTVYVADYLNHRIRRIAVASGAVTTLAGNGTAGFADGIGSDAQFNRPVGLAVAPNGLVFVADERNQRIRQIDPASGMVITLAGNATAGFADGVGSAARFNFPQGLAVAASGVLYVADGGNHRIRQIDPLTGAVTTLAGSTQGFADGVGSAAQFDSPSGVAVASSGTVYVTDRRNHRIVQVDPGTTEVTTIAGGTRGEEDGIGSAASFDNPIGVAFTSSGALFIAQSNGGLIRRLDLGTAEVTTVAGNRFATGYQDGIGEKASFLGPGGLAVAADGTLYVADQFNHRIRKVQLE